ncbi:hypothetical protein SAMN05443144_10564 [Fodinibius roseus]|uniref:Prokaryotic glutathione synthetase ATP-binding domain-containing protein n=1 Tax=Fodinibius roseus TaxID=1194090 RepID=A0A1M4YH69_9BACT|nr:hypothetical protein [Fodinibius roseus]SHF05145.1 hypothetical protein SAMN05443144_10564 [Fodinibius roseus]
MKKCAFLSMDSLDGYECYDHLLFDPLAERGWSAEEVSWRNGQVDWNRFDVVLIRSPWDYQQDPQKFFRVLQEIDRSSAILENTLELVEWNIDKTYLRDLQQEGIEIVPSLWKDRFDSRDWDSFFSGLSAEEIIIKPTISAGAEDTFRLRKSEGEKYAEQLSGIFSRRPFIVQPFMPSVVSEGEFSLFYFGNTYSHTILKTPKKNDFRVQEEFGGQLQKIEAGEQLLATGRQILELIEPDPLYTRIDLVRTSNHAFALMELELIEPSLYFNMDSASPRRFAAVFDRWMR